MNFKEQDSSPRNQQQPPQMQAQNNVDSSDHESMPELISQNHGSSQSVDKEPVISEKTINQQQQPNRQQAAEFINDPDNISSIQRLLAQRTQIQNLQQRQQQIAPTIDTHKYFQQQSVSAYEEAKEKISPKSSAPSLASKIQTQQQKQQQQQQTSQEDSSSYFECNICLDTAKEPVVSPCGHLYCWPCIYQWLKQPRDSLVCPVCKSGINQEMLIPIYTKGNNEDPRKKSESGGNIPGRPQGRRSEPQQNNNFQNQNGLFGGGNGSQFMMGLGIFPSLFSLNFTWDNIGADTNMANGNAANNEETREQQLQRLLGVFVFFLMFSFMTFGGDVFLTF